MLYHSPWIIQDATPKIVDALLMLIFRLGMEPCRCLFCSSKLPICWLWIPVSKWHPNGLTTYQTKNRWRSIDAHFQNVAVTVSISLLPIKAANTLVMDNSEQLSLQLTYLWHKISLTLRWRSVSECGCYHAVVSFDNKGCQSVDYELQWANNFPINSRKYPTIIDAPLTLIVEMGLFPCRFNNHIVIIDIQWIICTNTQLHAKAWWCINFLSTDAEVLWAMDDIAQWHFSAFSWQFTACRAIT